MRFFVFTLGCKINQYESQALREAWLERGHEETAAPGQADVVLVHTCAVTAGAVADSRRTVRRAARLAPGARVVVAGCASQVDPETFSALPGVALVAPQAAKPGLADWSPALVDLRPSRGGAQPDGAPFSDETDRGAALLRSPARTASPPCARPAGSDAPGAPRAKAWPAFSVRGSTRSRPVLKVQDGCSHGCAYCIVPRARGGPRSRPFAQIEAEARRMLAAGHREIVLAGINLGQFALDGGSGDFWDMLAGLEAALAPDWAGRARLRLSSLDPGMLGDKALDVLAASARGAGMVCPHLHLSLQSAAPAVLAAMNRSHYTARGALAFLDRLGAVWPVFGLGADILTGFPGESEADFRATLDFFHQAPLSYAHVFAYSKRPGTPAAKACGQVADAVKKARSLALREAARASELAFAARLAALPGLVAAPERLDPWSGVCEYYVECNMRPGKTPTGRELMRVRPLGVSDASLIVEET